MEFNATDARVRVGIVRPSGRIKALNSTSALRSGVKSPFRIALVRCQLVQFRTRLTVPWAIAPAGTTSRSNTKTGSRSFASTGVPTRVKRRLVRYRRRGAPEGTSSETLGVSSLAGVCAVANAEKRKTQATNSPIFMATPTGHYPSTRDSDSVMLARDSSRTEPVSTRQWYPARRLERAQVC